MFVNESIYVFESSLSTLGLLQLGETGGWGTALIFGILTSIGLLIKSAFVYYIHYWAPKDRPLNTLILVDNVRNSSTSIQIHCLNFKTFDFSSDNPVLPSVCLGYSDIFASWNSNFFS